MTTFCHRVELAANPGKAGSLWMTVQHTLCRAVAATGASTDLGALLAAAVVALLVQREER
jgi:hypothetical protein